VTSHTYLYIGKSSSGRIDDAAMAFFAFEHLCVDLVTVRNGLFHHRAGKKGMPPETHKKNRQNKNYTEKDFFCYCHSGALITPLCVRDFRGYQKEMQ